MLADYFLLLSNNSEIVFPYVLRLKMLPTTVENLETPLGGHLQTSNFSVLVLQIF